MEEPWRKRGTGISMASIYLRQDTAIKGDTLACAKIQIWREKLSRNTFQQQPLLPYSASPL